MYRIDEETCSGCSACLRACPTGAIYMIDNQAHIDEDRCAQCGVCAKICSNNAIHEKEVARMSQESVLQKAQIVASVKTMSNKNSPFLTQPHSTLKDALSSTSGVIETGKKWSIGFLGHGRGRRRKCGRKIQRRWYA